MMAETLNKILQPTEALEDSSISVEPFFEMTLDLPPSCLAFLPHQGGYFHDVDHVIIGTYNLDPTKVTSPDQSDAVQSRSGSLVLLELKDLRLEFLRTKTTPYAVLDLQFCPFDHEVFAVSTSVGSVDLYCVTNQRTGFEIVRSFQVASPSVLVLSLAWSSPLSSENSAIAISLSDGRIGYLSYTANDQSIHLSQAHTLEAWTIAWSEVQCESDVHRSLYSGGDDSILSKRGIASKCDWCCEGDGVLETALGSQGEDRKSHSAGVTAILPIDYLEGEDQVIITGSYDEYIRVLTLRNGHKRATVLAEKRIFGGGVWRLKLIKSDQQLTKSKKFDFLLLASCMHAGPRLIRIRRTSEGQWEINIVAKCVKHQSMNYASDAVRHDLGDFGDPFYVVSTSFYDRMICVWDGVC